MFSNVSPWLHKGSAFAVAAVGSIAAWDWAGIVSAHTAAEVVSVLGLAKLILEFVAGQSAA